MNTCIYSKEQFQTASGEHILQNSFGVRWTSSTIVCDRVQAYFGRTIDSEIDKHFREIRNLLRINSGRRDPAPTIKGLKTADGQVIDLEPGGKPRFSRPNVECKQTEDGKYLVQIQLGHRGQLGWALHELRKQYPRLKIEENEILKTAQRGRDYIHSPVHTPLVFGGKEYARAIVKACMNLLAANGCPALDASFDRAREFVLNGIGEFQNFLRWPIKEPVPPLPILGPVDHYIGFTSRRSRVEGIVQLFGGIYHSICLSQNYSGPALSFGYLVDPLREAEPAETRTPEVNSDFIPVFADQPEHLGSEAQSLMRIGMTDIMETFQARSRKEMITECMMEAFGPPDGQPITEAQIAKLSSLVARRFLKLPDDF